jgi:hypothetical protein
VLTGIARAWPNPLVREAAKEGALGLIAGQIKTGDFGAVRRAGAMFAELESGDKLLTRDIARFTNGTIDLEKKQPRKVTSRPLAHASGTKGLTVEHRGSVDFQNRPGCEFLTGISGEGNELYVLACKHESHEAMSSLILMAGDWHEQRSWTSATWMDLSGIFAHNPALTLRPHGVLMISGLSAVNADEAIDLALRTVARDTGRSPLSAGRPSWIKGREGSVTLCGDLWCLGLPDAEGVRLDFIDAAGQQRQSVVADFKSAGYPGSSLFDLAAHGMHVFMAVTGGLMVWHDGAVEAVELQSGPRHLAVSPTWARAAVVAGCEHGAYLYSPHSQQCLTLDRDLAAPVVGFTGRSHVIALGAKEGIAAQAEGGLFTRFQRFPWTHGKPLAILPHPDGDTFGVLTAAGRVEIVRLRETG